MANAHSKQSAVVPHNESVWGEGDGTESGFCDLRKTRFAAAHFGLLES